MIRTAGALCISFGVGLLFGSSPALADGKRDLEDGIAFYENLDIDRAMYRLTQAVEAKDLSSPDRARGYLYIGLLHFELGQRAQADQSWETAVRLDPKVVAPDGTSPKTLAALDLIRERVARTPAPPPREPAPPPGPEPPVLEPPPPSELSSEPPPPNLDPRSLDAAEDSESSGTSPWLWVGLGAGVAVVAGAVVAGIALSGGGTESECAQGGGGCISIIVR